NRTPMKLLLVHENLGAFGGAEANILLTANELLNRGHSIALLYRSGTGKAEEQWRQTFSPCFELLASDGPGMVSETLESLNPDLIYLHNFSSLEAIEELMDSGVPLVRMVHDHSMYCLRTYKYNYLTRKVCHRPLSPYCVFPCLASIGRNHQGSFPVQWNSYAEK